MKAVVWKYQDVEDDDSVHFLLHSDQTLCGLFDEGAGNWAVDQAFVYSDKKVDCKTCIDIVEACKKVKRKQYD